MRTGDYFPARVARKHCTPAFPGVIEGRISLGARDRRRGKERGREQVERKPKAHSTRRALDRPDRRRPTFRTSDFRPSYLPYQAASFHSGNVLELGLTKSGKMVRIGRRRSDRGANYKTARRCAQVVIPSITHHFPLFLHEPSTHHKYFIPHSLSSLFSLFFSLLSSVLLALFLEGIHHCKASSPLHLFLSLSSCSLFICASYSSLLFNNFFSTVDMRRVVVYLYAFNTFFCTVLM